MKDETLFARLNDYVDGALPAAERLELERRIEADPALRAELEEIRSVVERARELPRSLEPPRDLWPAIEARLGEEGRVVPGNFGGWGRRLLAIAALLLIFAAGLFTGVLRSGDRDMQVAEAPGDAPADVMTEAPERVTGRVLRPGEVELDAEYVAAAEQLFRRLEASDDELDGATVETIRRNLDIIDEAVREIREALEHDPQNARLEHMLNEGYRKRSNVLRRAADLRETI